MLIRLGYACISETLDNVTSSSTYTYTNFMKEKNYDKLDRIIVSNFLDLEKIINYNIKNNIHFYRLSSGIIPLATKSDVLFDYINKYQYFYKKIGNLVKTNNMRVDFHPSEYCVLNSTRSEVVQNSIDILEYHYRLLEQFGIDDKVLVLHVGSNQFGKKQSISRFINNFRKLPKYLQNVIAIENDDKIFNVEDCLEISSKINVPVVFDYHHFLCNKSSLDYEKIISTWNKRVKMHFSSPKNKTKKEFRSHHDYIDPDSFIEFLDSIKDLKCDIDIMIEAKKKDEAMFRLIRNLKYKTDYEFIDDTSFILK